ncbi:phage tail tape measure protein [Streptomyces sp. NPDC091212]|uniref:phage tail tape measure protein n=1 Tax=Streptomyces sp. NPDC091212 TaxID=3155191 RepID=UPI003422D222
MADRTVRVRVIADTLGFAAGMRGAAGAAAGFGRQAAAAGAGVRGLTAATAGARRGVTAVGAGARGGAAGLRDSASASAAARRGLASVGSTGAGVAPVFGRIGASARSGMGTAARAVSSVLAPVRSLGTLLAGGAIIYGLADVVHQGNDYTDSLNKFGAVTRASGAEMKAAGREAQALGADIKLPAATAAGAADAMVELAKAGLSATDSMRAARGTLQLAAAARTDVAMAARIEGDIMDQFAMKGSQATIVADTLANTVNNSSGELIDLYYAMKYVGPIAHGMGVSIQETATSVGLLGKAGIIGETAGTTLRGMLSRMAAPTKQAKKGLRELGIEAFDSAGKFRGMEYVVGKLAEAHHHLTQKEFTSAAAMAFGKPALSGATALAHQGAEAYGILSDQIHRAGGAADIAASASLGLGGAMRTAGAQVKGAMLQVYLGVSPVLERITRGMGNSIAGSIPHIKRGVKIASTLWDVYGPAVEKKVAAAGAGVKRQAVKLVDPLKDVARTGLVAVLPVLAGAGYAVVTVFQNAARAVSPLVDGIAAVVSSAGSAAGALGILGVAGGGALAVLGQASAVLVPLAQLVGGLGKAFGGLPGPVQLAVLSMLALGATRGRILGLQAAVTGYGRAGVNAFRSIGDSALYQRVLAAGAGKELSRFGGYVAAMEARSPAIARMGEAFRTTAGSIQRADGRAAGFRSTLGGLGAAAGSGAMSGLRGLVGFLGGPWGVAIAGAMVGLSYLARRQQEAAAAAAAHKQRVSDLAKALQDSNGVIDGNVRATVVQTLADAKAKDSKRALLEVTRDAGLTTRQVTDAYLGQGQTVDGLRKQLQKAADDTKHFKSIGKGVVEVMTPQGQAYKAAADSLGSLSGEMDAAVRHAKDVADATRGSGDAALAATNPTGRLNDAIKTLADSTADADSKSRALHQALQLLSGGELDAQAAVAGFNEKLAQLADLTQKVDQKKGWGQLDDMSKSLISVDGKLNTTTSNGRNLFNQLQDLNGGAASAAQATYDLARANGDEAAPALAKATTHMETAWQAAVKAGRSFGLTKEQAMELANSMGFIPSNLAITMDTPGLSKTMKDLLYVQGLAGHMPKDSKIRVSALTNDATRQLKDLGFKIRTLPGGRQVEITAPTGKPISDLDALIKKKIPGKTVPVSAETQKALNDLDGVQRKVAGTKGKTVTVSTLTDRAQKALQDLGFKIDRTKGKSVTITIPTGGPKAATDAIKGYISSVTGKTVQITTFSKYVSVGKPQAGQQWLSGAKKASGGPVRARGYADGGEVQYIPEGGPVSGPGTSTSDSIPTWLSNNEYVIKAAAVRRYGPAMFDALNAERFASGGAVGGGFTYAPTEVKSTLGAGSGMDRYQAAVQRLKDAWAKLTEAQKKAAAGSKAVQAAQKKEAQTRKDNARKVSQAEENLAKVRGGKHTAKQLEAAERRLSNARYQAAKSNAAAAKKTSDAEKKALAGSKQVKEAQKKVNAADAALGLKSGSKAPSGFNLTGYQKQLAAAVKASEAWESSLTKIGRRAGSDIEETLRGMGEEGRLLVAALGKASTKQFNAIVANLRKLGPTAKATLADYTKQLTSANKQGAVFQDNLLKLAAMGYGDLAAQLASQGDDTAATIAAAAVKDKNAAAKANTAAKNNTQLLTSEELTAAATLLGVLRSKPGAGIADVIAAGLDWATVRALAPKIGAQIKAVSGSETFRGQMQGQGVAMAKGGILPDSSYTVLAGERGTGGEAWIPLGAGNRARSTALLSSVAGLFGHHLSPVRGGGGSQPVVQHITNNRSVQLNGAKQTSAEQAADVARHMAFIG